MRIINLLPPDEQQNLHLEKIFGYLKRFTAFTFLIYVLLSAGFFAWRILLEQSLSNIDNDIKKAQAQINAQDNKKIQAEVQKDNNIVIDYNKLGADLPVWSNVLNEFNSLVPANVAISNFSANLKTGKIDISGTGQTRDAVLQLRTNILGSAKFKNINLPLENLQKPKNTPFNYSFYLVEGVLKRIANEAK